MILAVMRQGSSGCVRESSGGETLINIAIGRYDNNIGG